MANMATVSCSIFDANEMPLIDVHDNFLMTFLLEPDSLNMEVASLFMVLKHCLLADELVRMPDDEKRGAFLERLFPVDLEEQLRQLHVDAPFSDQEEQFIKDMMVAKERLAEAAKSEETRRKLKEDYPLERLRDELRFFLRSNEDALVRYADSHGIDFPFEEDPAPDEMVIDDPVASAHEPFQASTNAESFSVISNNIASMLKAALGGPSTAAQSIPYTPSVAPVAPVGPVAPAALATTTTATAPTHAPTSMTTPSIASALLSALGAGPSSYLSPTPTATPAAVPTSAPAVAPATTQPTPEASLAGALAALGANNPPQASSPPPSLFSSGVTKLLQEAMQKSAARMSAEAASSSSTAAPAPAPTPAPAPAPAPTVAPVSAAVSVPASAPPFQGSTASASSVPAPAPSTSAPATSAPAQAMKPSTIMGLADLIRAKIDKDGASVARPSVPAAPSPIALATYSTPGHMPLSNGLMNMANSFANNISNGNNSNLMLQNRNSTFGFPPHMSHQQPLAPPPERSGDGSSLPPHQSSPSSILYQQARQAAATKTQTHTRREGLHSTRRPWSPDEEQALMAGLDMVKGPHWSQILQLFGANGTISDILKDRSQVQLKDKARNLKLFFLKANTEMPYYLKCVTGELKTRAPSQAARKEAEERARANNKEEQARVQGIMTLAGGLQDKAQGATGHMLSMAPAAPGTQRTVGYPGMAGTPGTPIQQVPGAFGRSLGHGAAGYNGAGAPRYGGMVGGVGTMASANIKPAVNGTGIPTTNGGPQLIRPALAPNVTTAGMAGGAGTAPAPATPVSRPLGIAPATNGAAPGVQSNGANPALNTAVSAGGPPTNNAATASATSAAATPPPRTATASPAALTLKQQIELELQKRQPPSTPTPTGAQPHSQTQQQQQQQQQAANKAPPRTATPVVTTAGTSATTAGITSTAGATNTNLSNLATSALRQQSPISATLAAAMSRTGFPITAKALVNGGFSSPSYSAATTAASPFTAGMSAALQAAINSAAAAARPSTTPYMTTAQRIALQQQQAAATAAAAAGRASGGASSSTNSPARTMTMTTPANKVAAPTMMKTTAPTATANTLGPKPAVQQKPLVPAAASATPSPALSATNLATGAAAAAPARTPTPTQGPAQAQTGPTQPKPTAPATPVAGVAAGTPTTSADATPKPAAAQVSTAPAPAFVASATASPAPTAATLANPASKASTPGPTPAPAPSAAPGAAPTAPAHAASASKASPAPASAPTPSPVPSLAPAAASTPTPSPAPAKDAAAAIASLPATPKAAPAVSNSSTPAPASSTGTPIPAHAPAPQPAPRPQQRQEEDASEESVLRRLLASPPV